MLGEQTITISPVDAVARDLHDKLGPALSAAEIRIRKASRGSESQAGDLSLALAEIERARIELREILCQLRGEQTGCRNVYDAINSALEPLQQKVQVAFEHSSDYSLSPDVEAEIALIATEAINNVARHADATLLQVAFSNFDGECLLEVVDDGCGFEPGSGSCNSYGILGMRERADQIGATFRINSTIEEGTVIQCTLNRI